MFVPFISEPSVERRKLWRRKGGGGGGRGGGGGGGRTTGGGTRDNVYGNSAYGSGYPGVAGRGTAGRGFPFVFWPVAFVGAGSYGGAHYYHNSEYGRADNSTRPGGAQVTAAFTSNSQGTVFRVLADNTTVVSLIQSIEGNCSSSLQSTGISPSPYLGADQSLPLPEQVIQYYRASSVALSLDGYNNSAVFTEDENAADTPIPTNIDTTLLNCMNSTIGNEVPLVDSGAASLSLGSGIHSNVGLLGIAGMVWLLSSMV
ncbi:hypothetical protein H1R20_g2186, partial [Candolleomyces eurysporus]